MTRTKQLLIPAAALAAMLGTAQADAAVVQVVDTDSAHTANNSTPNDFTLTDQGPDGSRDGIYSYSYSAGASLDMLVVSVSHESSSQQFTVSYDGVDMTKATGSDTGSGAAIFYLATTTQSGTIALDFTTHDVVDGTVNGIGIGIAAIESDNGDPIALFDAATVGGSANGSVSIDTADNSFTMLGIDTNGGDFGGSSTTNSVATAANIDVQIDKVTDIGSNGFGAAYALEAVGATGVTYAIMPSDLTKDRGFAAANFYVVPEPGSLALLATGGLLMIKRRRRDSI